MIKKLDGQKKPNECDCRTKEEKCWQNIVLCGGSSKKLAEWQAGFVSVLLYSENIYEKLMISNKSKRADKHVKDSQPV